MNIICTVDILTRHIALPAGVQIASYDHNVDVIQFNIEPIEDFSLNTSSIKIAAQGPNKARHDYAVDPSTVAIEEETGYITFDWPIPAGVTEMPIGTFKYGDKGQLIFAVCAEIISGSTVSKAWHSDDGIITVVAHLEPEAGGGEDPEEEATNAQKIGQLQTDVAVINTQVGALANGSPAPAGTVAEMTEHDKVYLYTGSETGESTGYWYSYDSTQEKFVPRGEYGGAVTDTTFTLPDVPADSKEVGDALAEVNDRLQAQADDVYSKAVSKNLMGMEVGKYYPVNLPQGTQLVITRSDGSVFPTDNVERLYMYDADRQYVDYASLKTGTNYKVTPGMRSDVAYLRWHDDNGGTYDVPMMVVTLADRGIPYAEYFENVRQLAGRYNSDAAEISGEIESLSDDVYANAVSKNLMGMESKMYRVDLSVGDYITVSKQDGSIFDTASTQKLYCFDDKKKWTQTRTLNHGAAYETFILTKDVAYLQWYADDSYPLDTPMMVAKSNNPLEYTEYFESVKTLDNDGEVTPYYSQNSATSYGVTFTWSDGVCTISGTANHAGYSVNNYLLKSSQNKPLIFEVGKKLYIHYHVTSPAILFEIDAYKYDEDSGTYKAFDVFVMRGPGWYTVPAGTERLALSIRIQDGTTIIGKFSDFGIFETYPKKRIEQCPNLPLLVTLTDDDTLTDEDVEHFHGCLMHNGVQGGYAFIGRRVEEAGTTTIAKMQEVEDDGFDVLPHCWTQATYFLNGETRDIAQCMSNMVKIKRYMAEHQLMSQDQWIVPYGVTDEGIRHVAKSLGFKMMFSSATKDFNRAIDTERYRTKRVGFHPTWTEQSNIQLPELKALVDKMVEYGGGWMVVCCHVKDWNKNNWPNNPEMWVEFDETLDANGYPIGYAPLNEFISYAKTVGCTFVNVREGYRWIEPYLLDT